MQIPELIITVTMFGAMLCAPAAPPSTRPFDRAGSWVAVGTESRETHATGEAGTLWHTSGSWGRAESALERPEVVGAHRVALAWSTLPASLRAGDVLPLQASALVATAQNLDDAAAVEIGVVGSGRAPGFRPATRGCRARIQRACRRTGPRGHGVARTCAVGAGAGGAHPARACDRDAPRQHAHVHALVRADAGAGKLRSGLNRHFLSP